MKAKVATRVLVALLFCSWTVLPGVGQSGGAIANIWLTTPNQSQLLAPQGAVAFAADSGSNPLTIDVDASQQYQQMDGFGASFTDSSAWLVYSVLSSTARSQLMTALFDPVNGIGLSYLRQPMGATDFALSNYTYDDVQAGATDPTLSQFSIAHDQQWIVPVVKQALNINPAIRVIATPWSPPAWMKTNQSLFGGSLTNDPTTKTALANYFVKFIQAYTAAGVPIHRITPQNEPLNTSSTYPTMYMDAATQSDFILNYLVPAFNSAALSTEIVAYDHNWDNTTYPESVLTSGAGPYVVGSAWHCYAGTPDAMTTVHDATGKDVFFTECSAGAWSTSFSSNLKWDMENLVIGATRNWARTVTKWNIALDNNYGPQNGGCTNCTGLVTINRRVTPATYSLNFDYYSLGHISKFVQPGAYRIASNTFGSGSIEDVAFRNPDGSEVLIVLNADSKSDTFKVREAGQSFSYTLGAGSVATFTWNSSTPPPPPPQDQPPGVSMITPASNSTFTAPTTISLTANAWDNDGSVTKVQYYSGSTLVGSSTAGSSWTASWKVTSTGTYTLTAVATDNAGLQATSAPVTVTVKRRK